MKPNTKNCKGCPHFTRNLHFPTGLTRLFCNLVAQYLRTLKNCPRKRIQLTQEADTIRKEKQK